MNISKFRAWNKKRGGIFKVNAIRFNHPNGFEPTVLVDEDNGLERTLKLDDCILMQSTGFVDDNNIEIFEGDIVNCGYFTNGDLLGKLEEKEEKGIIEFLKGAFYIKFLYDRYLLSDIFESCTHIEIIGNIYENKELLED